MQTRSSSASTLSRRRIEALSRNWRRVMGCPQSTSRRSTSMPRGLIAYGPSYPDLYRRAAIYVDKILRGASPSGLPVEQPTKFELIINVKAARAIGLQVPMALMVRADEVIE